MDHPRLIRPPDHGLHRQCPCDVIIEQPDRLCLKCQARMAWRRRTTRTNCRAARQLTARQAHEGTRIFASATALSTTISEGVEN
jgi:hypothetical protein